MLGTRHIVLAMVTLCVTGSFLPAQGKGSELFHTAKGGGAAAANQAVRTTRAASATNAVEESRRPRRVIPIYTIEHGLRMRGAIRALGQPDQASVTALTTDAPGGNARATPSPSHSAEQEKADQDTSSSWTPPPQEKLPLGEPAPMRAGAQTNSDSIGETNWVLRTFLALGVVIALIYGLRWMLARMSGAAAGKAMGAAGSVGQVVQVLGRTTVAPRTQVVLLQINQRIIVAGHSPNGFNALTSLDDPEDVAWVLQRLEAGKAASISQGFRQVLKRFESEYSTSEREGEREERRPEKDRTRREVAGLLNRVRSMRSRDQ